MTSPPTHITHAIPGAIDTLTHPLDLPHLCAALDPDNPHALKHWTTRLRQMRRFPGADEALRYFLFELFSRRTYKQARSKSYTDVIRNPAAWLNAQTLRWITADHETATNTRRTSQP